MKITLYKLLTIQNGIVITPEAMECLLQHIETEEKALDFIRHFKSKYNTSFIHRNQIEELVKTEKEESQFYNIIPTKYSSISRSKFYESMRNQMHEAITPISMLQPGTPATIFGIFYKGQSGRHILEDNHGTVEFSLRNCENDAFIREGFFIALEGHYGLNSGEMVQENVSHPPITEEEQDIAGRTKEQKEFQVKRILYPAIPEINNVNNFLNRKSETICVFGCFSDNKELLDEAVKRFNPGLVVLSLCGENVPETQFSGTMVVFPCRCGKSFLPQKLKKELRMGYRRIMPTTNPFDLELFNKRITFIDQNVFKLKEGGVFCKGNSLRSFLEGCMSQGIRNVVGNCDVAENRSSDITVILQDFYSFVMNISGGTIVSIPRCKERVYGVIRTDTSEVEIVSMKELDE